MAETMQGQAQTTVDYDGALFAGYPDLLTPKHIAELTGMSVQYVRSLCRTGQIPAVQVGKSRWYTPKNRFIAFVNGACIE